MVDAYQKLPAVDKRWLAIARTHIEQGFMAMNRSIFNPERVTLPKKAVEAAEQAVAADALPEKSA